MLRELRKARKLIQVSVACELGIRRHAISRLEQRSNVWLSTLRQTAWAIGGTLSLIAVARACVRRFSGVLCWSKTLRMLEVRSRRSMSPACLYVADGSRNLAAWAP